MKSVRRRRYDYISDTNSNFCVLDFYVCDFGVPSMMTKTIEELKAAWDVAWDASYAAWDASYSPRSAKAAKVAWDAYEDALKEKE